MTGPVDKAAIGRIVLYRSALGIEPAIITASYNQIPTGAPALTSPSHVHLTRFTTDPLTQGAPVGTHPGGATQAFNVPEDTRTSGETTGPYTGPQTPNTWRWPSLV